MGQDQTRELKVEELVDGLQTILRYLKNVPELYSDPRQTKNIDLVVKDVEDLRAGMGTEQLALRYNLRGDRAERIYGTTHVPCVG